MSLFEGLKNLITHTLTEEERELLVNDISRYENALEILLNKYVTAKFERESASKDVGSCFFVVYFKMDRSKIILQV